MQNIEINETTDNYKDVAELVKYLLIELDHKWKSENNKILWE